MFGLTLLTPTTPSVPATLTSRGSLDYIGVSDEEAVEIWNVWINWPQKERAHTADQAASAQASRRFTTCIAEKMAAVYKDCTQETGRFALPCHADHCGFWIVCQLLGDPSTSR